MRKPYSSEILILLIYVIQLVTAIVYFPLHFKHYVVAKAIIKPIPVLLNIPLVAKLYDWHIQQKYGSKPEPQKRMKIFHIIGLVLGSIGDILLAFDTNVLFIIGAISFLTGHAFYLGSYIPRSGIKSPAQLVTRIILCVISAAALDLVLFNTNPMKVLLSIGMPIYLLVEGSVVVMTSLEPKKVESCARDRALGQLGAFLFYLSDVVLLCGMCLPYGIILRDFLVMLTYYSGQFLLAYGTRQWSSFNAKLPLKGDEDRIRLSTNTEPTYSKDVEQGYILWAASDPALLKQFNFKGFANEKYNYNTTLEGMLFEFNFLRPLVNTKCTQADCVASKIQNNNCVCLGENSTVQWDEIPNNNGIFFTFESKDFMVSYKLTLQITCGKTNTLEIADPYTNTHVWTYPSKYGCRAGGGLGWGWVFIIILFSSLALFFIIGIPINKCGRKKSGIEVVPFGYFWVGIPRMVMEGVKCLFSPCRKRQRGFEAMD